MPSPEDTLKSAASAYVKREADYGDTAATIVTAADIASILLGKPLTPHEICLVAIALKQAHLVKNPGDQNAYVELVNAVSFAAAFAPAKGLQAEKAA